MDNVVDGCSLTALLSVSETEELEVDGGICGVEICLQKKQPEMLFPYFKKPVLEFWVTGGVSVIYEVL